MLKRTLTAGTLAAVLGAVGLAGPVSPASAMSPAQCQAPQFQSATTGPKLDIADVGQVRESSGVATFRLTLSTAPTSDVTVNVCTADGAESGSPAVSGTTNDYLDVDTNVTFRPARWEYRKVCSFTPQYQCSYQFVRAPAETVKYVSVRINNNTTADFQYESFRLVARSISGGFIRDGEGIATIVNG
jgi:hypothetical protein